MKIPSDQIPQADKLFDVAKTAECVANGATTYQDIATGIGKVERQGRYYRKAAEIIGFTESTGSNHSELTTLGASWVAANAAQRKVILIQAVLNTRLFQRIIPFLESRTQGAKRERLVQFLDDVAELGGPTMAPRRIATIIHWLEECDLVSERAGRYFLNRLPDGVLFIDYSDNETEPLIPSGYGLNDYIEHEKNFKKRSGFTTVLVDQAKHERANANHRDLIKLVATRIKAAGSVPRVGKLIDLAAAHESENYIFEMKSLTGENGRSQIRQGISQLYEYRYIEQSPNAHLVLVLQNKLEKDIQWMTDYLLEDRNVKILWDGDGNLYCPGSIHKEFEFLRPIAV